MIVQIDDKDFEAAVLRGMKETIGCYPYFASGHPDIRIAAKDLSDELLKQLTSGAMCSASIACGSISMSHVGGIIASGQIDDYLAAMRSGSYVYKS